MKNLKINFQEEQNNIKPEINTGYKDAYLSFMGKLTQNCTFCILDDYNYYQKHENKHAIFIRSIKYIMIICCEIGFKKA